jgi:hypothetical protein
MALEGTGEEQMPRRPGRPPDHLGQVDTQVTVVLLLGSLARVGVNGQVGGGAGCPEVLVDLTAVRGPVPPHGRDHHAPDAGLLRGPLGLGHRPMGIVAQRDEGDSGPTLRAGRTQLGQEAVVRLRPGEGQVGLVDLPGGQPGAERWRAHAGDGVGVGEQHVGRDAVAVELAVADIRVVGPPQTVLVGGLPSHDVLEIGLELLGPLGLLHRHPLVEGLVEPGLEVGPVVGQG